MIVNTTGRGGRKILRPYINALSDSEVRRDLMAVAWICLPHDAVVFFGVGGFIIVAPQKLARGEWRGEEMGIKKGTARRGGGDAERSGVCHIEMI